MAFDRFNEAKAKIGDGKERVGRTFGHAKTAAVNAIAPIPGVGEEVPHNAFSKKRIAKKVEEGSMRTAVVPKLKKVQQPLASFEYEEITDENGNVVARNYARNPDGSFYTRQMPNVHVDVQVPENPSRLGRAFGRKGKTKEIIGGAVDPVDVSELSPEAQAAYQELVRYHDVQPAVIRTHSTPEEAALSKLRREMAKEIEEEGLALLEHGDAGLAIVAEEAAIYDAMKTDTFGKAMAHYQTRTQLRRYNERVGEARKRVPEAEKALEDIKKDPIDTASHGPIGFLTRAGKALIDGQTGHLDERISVTYDKDTGEYNLNYATPERPDAGGSVGIENVDPKILRIRVDTPWYKDAVNRVMTTLGKNERHITDSGVVRITEVGSNAVLAEAYSTNAQEVADRILGAGTANKTLIESTQPGAPILPYAAVGIDSDVIVEKSLQAANEVNSPRGRSRRSLVTQVSKAGSEAAAKKRKFGRGNFSEQANARQARKNSRREQSNTGRTAQSGQSSQPVILNVERDEHITVVTERRGQFTVQRFIPNND